MWGHIKVVKWLVEHKVNLNIFDSNKETAYDLAKKHQHIEVANYLAGLMGKPLIEK